jgi:tetratricopeptide (TPR) repeat protein
MKPTIRQDDEQAKLRAARALGLLALLLWAASCYRQSLPYPFYGALWAGVLTVICFVAGWLTFVDRVLRRRQVVALGATFAFTAWAALRWLMQGRSTVGVENLITLITWCGWIFAAANLSTLLWIGDTRESRDRRARPLVMAWALGALSLLAALFCIHAVAQYAFLYDWQLADLRASIGNRQPTALEMGLIHHLQLKRVASVWGDPNAFGCFCVLGLGAACYMWQQARWLMRWPAALRAGALVVGLLCVIGIGLSRSRGAALDALVLGGALGVGWIRARRAARALALLALVALPLIGATQSSPPPPKLASEAAKPTWWRSDTIRERVHYARIGWSIFRQNPIAGAGLGSVEMYFGRLKPAEARESKYLHNWALQIAAEMGLVGLTLYLAALGCVLWLLWRPVGGRSGEHVVLAALLLAFIVDSTIQLSFNQRELMSTFGALCGMAIALGGGNAVAPAGRGRHHAGAFLMGIAVSLALALIAIPRAMGNGFRELAEDYLNSNEVRESRKYISRAVRWQEQDPTVQALLAVIGTASDDLALAERALRRAIEAAPWSASCHAQLADVLEREQKFAEAERMLRRAVELYPTKAEYWHQLALFLERRGRVAEAAAAAERACEYSYLYPDEDRALLARLQQRLRATTSTAAAGGAR